jgi:hypothetical protein
MTHRRLRLFCTACAHAVSSAFVSSAVLSLDKLAVVQPCLPHAFGTGAKAFGAIMHLNSCSYGLNLRFAVRPGYRTQAHLRNGRPAIYTRAGYDWTLRFQPIAEALATFPVTDLILDGEAVVPDSRGVPDFGLLHADLAGGRTDRLLYYAFDPLYLDGFDLRGARLAERKRVLAELLADAPDCIVYAVQSYSKGSRTVPDRSP